MRAHSLPSRKIKCDTDSTVDFRNLALLLRKCTCLKALKQLHDQISISGYDRNTYLGNHLIQMYGKCGSSEEAKKAFDGIKQKNLLSWNIMLTAFSNTGDLQQSIKLFQKLPRRDAFSWNSMIAAHSRNGDSISANEIFDEMADLKDAVSWNTVIAAYAESGQIQIAQQLFNEMPGRSKVSWNSMITGYSQNGEILKFKLIFDRLPEFNLLSCNLMLAAFVQNGLGKEALGLLAALDSDGIEPDVFTITSTIDACGVVGDLALGRESHIELINRGDSNVVAATALITMYGRCGAVADSKLVFYEMRDRNVVSWNAIITALGENGRVDEAEEFFTRIPLSDLASWNVMLSGYARNGHIDSAKRIFSCIPERDVVTWNVMISAYSDDDLFRFEWDAHIGHTNDSAGRVLEAMSLVKRMDLEGIQANKVTFISALSACHGHAALQQGKLLHNLITELDLQDDVTIGTVLVIMYGKCGSPEDSKKAFDLMIGKRSSVTWNAMVAAYARNGHTLLAIELLRDLVLEGVQPHFMVFNSVLFACSHRGMLREGHLQFVVMVGEFEISPNFSHFLCLIDLLGRAGELRAAEELAEFMPFQSDSLVWTILLSACKSLNDVERGAITAQRLLAFDSQQAPPYTVLSSIMKGGS